MTLLVSVIVLPVALLFLAALCDEYLVRSLVRLGEERSWSQSTLGSGLLAVSSSAPELMIALVAVFVGGGEHASIGAATIIGSALFNLLVIVGACAWIRRLRLSGPTLARDCLFYVVGIGWLLWAAQDGRPGIGELAVALVVYGAYVLVLIWWEGGQSTSGGADAGQGDAPPRWRLDRRLLELLFRPLRTSEARVAGAVVLLAGLSWILVQAAIDLADGLGISENVLAITVLAIGTSVPDLLSSIAAARRDQGAMAVTNALGSNIFDILPGLALPWLAGVAFQDAGSISIATDELVKGTVVLGASVVLLPGLFLSGRHGGLGRPGGVVLLTIYLAYLAWQLLEAGAVP